MRVAAVLITGAFVALGIVALRHLREQPPPSPPPIRLALSVPVGVEAGAGDAVLDAAISPNESEIAFVAAREGVTRLWRRHLREEELHPIDGTEGARLPAWKQTANVIAFFSADRLKQVVLADGAVHDLAAVPMPAGATWLRDGSLLYASAAGGPIRRLLNGALSDATAMAAGDVRHEFPTAVVGADDFVYVAVRDDGRRVVRLVAGSSARDLINTSAHAAMVGGYVLHVRDGVLLGYARDEETGSLSPRGVTLALNVGIDASGRALFAASDRLLVHAPLAPRMQQLTWLDEGGRRLAPIGDVGDYWQVRLSPDDRQAAVTARDPLLRALDVVLVPADGQGDARRLTSAVAADTDPVWAPDGRRLLFRSLQRGTPALFVMPADGSGTAEAFADGNEDATASDWVRQGGTERVLLQARRAGGTLDVLVTDAPNGKAADLAAGGFNETDARSSPDGRWVAFVSDESGRPDIYAVSAGRRVRVSFGGGTRPRWTRDGRAVLFLRGSQVMRADLVDGDPPRFATSRVLFDAPGIRDFDTAHRSDRIAALLPEDAAAPPAISVVVNWKSLLAR